MPTSSRRRSRKSPIFIRWLGLLDIVFASFAAATAVILTAPKKKNSSPPRIALSSGRRCVVSENVVAIFCRHVAGKAFFVQRLIAGLAVGEVGVAPAAGPNSHDKRGTGTLVPEAAASVFSLAHT